MTTRARARTKTRMIWVRARALMPAGKVGRRGISVPLTAILLTAAMLAVTSAAALGALSITASAARAEADARRGDALILHNAIESVLMSNPGSSISVHLNLPGPVTCAQAQGGSRSIATYPLLLPQEVPDPAGVVLWNESYVGTNITRLVYAAKIGSFSVPAGPSSVTVKKEVDGSVTVGGQ